MQVGRGERGGKNTQTDSQHQTRFDAGSQSVYTDLACVSNKCLTRKSSLSSMHDGVGIYMTGGNKRSRVGDGERRHWVRLTKSAPRCERHRGLALQLNRPCTKGYKGHAVGVGWVKGTSNTDTGEACAERAVKHLMQRKTDKEMRGLRSPDSRNLSIIL